MNNRSSRCVWLSIVIDWHRLSSIADINRLIGIDCHRMPSIPIDHRFHRLGTPWKEWRRPSRFPAKIESLSNDNGEANKKGKKKKCLDWQNNSSAGASLHDHEVKLPNSTFCGGPEQSLQHLTFFFFSWTLIRSSRIELHSQKLPAFDELNDARWTAR